MSNLLDAERIGKKAALKAMARFAIFKALQRLDAKGAEEVGAGIVADEVLNGDPALAAHIGLTRDEWRALAAADLEQRWGS